MMKRLFLLTFVICIGQMASAFGQTSSNNFFIKNVYIDLNADTRYVRKLADKTISMYWDKKSNYEEIECFKNEIVKTNLFENFQTVLDLEEADEYNLTVVLSYRSNNPIYRIGSIRLLGFNEIDEAKFNSILAKSGINDKLLSLKKDFPVFENQVTQAVQESYVEKVRKEELGKPWIEIQLNSDGKLDVLVMPKFKGCSDIKN